MKHKIDLNMMTMDKETIEEYRELEKNLKGFFIWALGEKAVTEMTKTVRERPEQNELDSTILTNPPPLYTKKKPVPQSGRLLWKSTRTERNSRGCLDYNITDREKL